MRSFVGFADRRDDDRVRRIIPAHAGGRIVTGRERRVGVFALPRLGARLDHKEPGKRRLRLEKSSVSRIVTALEKRGWLARKGNPKDTRMVQVHLTDDGRQAAANIAASRQAKFQRIFAAIPAAERDTVLASLDTLLQVIRET